MEILQNVCFAHLQVLMNTSAKYQANWTETVELSGQDFADIPTTRPTNRPTDRHADSSLPPTNFVCEGIIMVSLNLYKVTKLWTYLNLKHSHIKNKIANVFNRNCLLQAISPFLTMFSTDIYLQRVKMRHCKVMG